MSATNAETLVGVTTMCKSTPLPRADEADQERGTVKQQTYIRRYKLLLSVPCVGCCRADSATGGELGAFELQVKGSAVLALVLAAVTNTPEFKLVSAI
jgi:hypothetical protein